MLEPEKEKSSIQIEKHIIRRYFYVSSISVVILLFIALSLNYSKGLLIEYNNKIKQLNSAIINEKKHYLRDAVERTIYFIEKERTQVQRIHAHKNLTQEQLESISKSRIGQYIRELRLIDDGYIWVNQIVDYSGGDNYAIRQIHPNLPQTEGMRLSTNMTDIKGGRPYETELNGIKKDGEIYFEYYFKKMNLAKIEHKMSFAKLYKPYDWVVATGVYLDDVDQFIADETQKMQKTYSEQRLRSYLIALFVVLASIMIIAVFEKLISGLIRSYENKISNHTNKLIDQKEKVEKALAEVNQLKGMLPICTHCKKIRDDKGYWNQIEAYLSEHSTAEFSHSICPDCTQKLYPDLDMGSD